MALFRRSIHVVAWVGTLVVALLSVALIVSQTPWFRDWIRRTIIREAKQYLNGELAVGRVTGNLFFDFGLSDVAVDLSGDRVIAIKALSVDYSVFTLLAGRIELNQITVTEPRVHLVKDGSGWNVGRLVKARAREADREGPGRSVSLPSITIVDGAVSTDTTAAPPANYRLPARISDLDVQASFEYEPVHFTIGLDALSFRGADPSFDVQQLAGGIAVRDDNLYLEKLTVKTGESAFNVGGVIESYLGTPVIKLVTDGTMSMAEFARVVPALEGYQLRPVLAINANGTTDRLTLDLDVRSEAGYIRGPLAVDLRAPDFSFAGPLHVERLNLGPILKNPAQKSEITGDLTFDVTLASGPAGVPALDRLKGTFAFAGPGVSAFGYAASQVKASGAFAGPRITIGDASVRAYGAAATTRGTIVLPQGRRAIAYDLQGTASNVDLRRLPRTTRAPQLDSRLALDSYHVKGNGTIVSGNATLDSSDVEGATIGAGTIVSFDTGAKPLAYSATGTVANLDVERLGRALGIAALSDARYTGPVNGSFDVTAAGTSLAELDLRASGTLRDTSMWGTRVASMDFTTEIDDRALLVGANGRFEHLNPAVILERKPFDGNVNGEVDGTFRISDLSAPITPTSVEVDGRVTLGPSLVGGVQIAGADIQGRYAGEIADITRLHVDGPDVTLEASGRIALGRDSSSSLKYHVDAPDIAELAEIFGQRSLEGAVVLDGTVTGNATALATTGTLSGNRLAYAGQSVLDVDSDYDVALADLNIETARVKATTQATFVKLGGLEINELSATTTYEKKRLEFDAKADQEGRSLAAGGSVIFHPDHQEVHLPRLTLAAQGIEWRNVAGTEAAIQYGNNQLTIKDLSLASADQSANQTLDVSGTIALDAATGPTGALAVRARNVDIAQVEAMLLQEHGFSGRLTADATITGNLKSPTVDGNVQVVEGGFKNYRFQSLVADVDYSDNRVTLDATLQQQPGVAVTAKGTMPTSVFERSTGEHETPTATESMDVRLQTANLNLGIIQGFTSAVSDVGGTLSAEVHVTGTGRDPHAVGYIEIAGGAFSVPRFGTSFSGLDTRIDLDPDVVRVRRFEILDENGEQLAVAGQLAVHERQVGAVDFTIESQNFEIIDNELGDVGVGTNLKVTGELTRPTVQGDIRIATGRLEVDRIIRLFYDPYRLESLPEVVSADRTAAQAGSAAEATRQALARAGQPQPPEAVVLETPKPVEPVRQSIFENVSLDVRVRIPDNLVARGRRLRPGGPTAASVGDINITLGGDLNIRKKPGGPVTLAGTVNTVRGTYQFQGRRFELARNGTLRFTGDAEWNPVLDLTATRTIPDTGVEARVRITGTLDAPSLALSSTPPLEESDILALIVFNRPINELGTGERASLAATAGGIATGFIATPLGESIGRALDLDLFEIAPTTDGDQLGAGITIGEQVGSRTFLKLRQTFGDQPTSEFMLEYQISDFLRLVGSAAPETSGAANRIGQRRVERAGIDLIFFFSY
jgi:autotransporter translocation and assembly factor TamB